MNNDNHKSWTINDLNHNSGDLGCDRCFVSCINTVTYVTLSVKMKCRLSGYKIRVRGYYTAKKSGYSSFNKVSVIKKSEIVRIQKSFRLKNFVNN